MIDRMIARWIAGIRVINHKPLSQQLLLFLMLYIMYSVIEHVSAAGALVVVVTLGAFGFPWFFGWVNEIERER